MRCFCHIIVVFLTLLLAGWANPPQVIEGSSPGQMYALTQVLKNLVNPTPDLSPTDFKGKPATLELLPATHFITIKGHQQRFAIDCEASAAVDWAAYYQTSIQEVDFQTKIPVSDNPEFGFVGSPNGEWGQIPPSSYGVYAQPIADLLNRYGVDAQAVKGVDLEWVKQNLAHDKPILVWVIGRLERSMPYIFTDKQGRQTIVAPYEHVVILTGYNDLTHKIRFMSEGVTFEAPYANLMASWSILGFQAIFQP